MMELVGMLFMRSMFRSMAWSSILVAIGTNGIRRLYVLSFTCTLPPRLSVRISFLIGSLTQVAASAVAISTTYPPFHMRVSALTCREGPSGPCMFVSAFWSECAISPWGVSSLKILWPSSMSRRICLSLMAVFALVRSVHGGEVLGAALVGGDLAASISTASLYGVCGVGWWALMLAIASLI